MHKANACAKNGLAASVFTRDPGPRHADESAPSAPAPSGSNCHAGFSLKAETGGYGQSGLGRLHGPEGLNDFLRDQATSNLEAGRI